MADESAADDGAIHRFWKFIVLRRAAGLPADTDTMLALLLLIVIFDAVADTISEPTMTQVFLTDLDVALAHLDPVEVGYSPIDPTYADSWRDRGRPPSTGDFVPEGVLCHHTASPQGTTTQSDLNVILAGNADAPGPISQLLIDRAGVLFIVAAGRANHGGSGVMPGESASTSMNARLLGIEVSNDGVGEAWPDYQIATYAATVAALIDYYGWPLDKVCLHWQTGQPAGNAKIDPAGPWMMQPDLPGGGAGSWDVDTWRVFVDGHRGGAAPIPPPVEVPDMTDDQARQLAELYANFVPAYPGPIPDPNGAPLNATWAIAHTYQLVQDINARVAALEAKS